MINNFLASEKETLPLRNATIQPRVSVLVFVKTKKQKQKHQDYRQQLRYRVFKNSCFVCWVPAFQSQLDGGEWLASRSGRFTPRERAPGTHWIGGWVGPRAGLDAVLRNIPYPCRESKTGGPARSLDTELPELPRLQVKSLTV
jgi:hypothetical protein